MQALLRVATSNPLPGFDLSKVMARVSKKNPNWSAERLANAGLSLSAIAARLGISRQAVHKRLNAVPPRLKDWPVLGTWADDGEADNDNSVNLSVSAA